MNAPRRTSHVLRALGLAVAIAACTGSGDPDSTPPDDTTTTTTPGAVIVGELEAVAQERVRIPTTPTVELVARRTLWLYFPSCLQQPTVEVVESADEVRLTAMIDDPGEGDRPTCQDGLVVELDSPLAGRSVINGWRDTEFDVDVSYGDLTMYEGVEPGDRELVGYLIDDGCGLSVDPINVDVAKRRPPDERLHLGWPAETTMFDRLLQRLVTPTTDGDDVSVFERDVVILRGGPVGAGRRISDPPPCGRRDVFVVSAVEGPPGVEAVRHAGIDLELATDAELVHLPLLTPGEELRPGELRLIPAVDLSCGPDAPIVAVNGRSWALLPEHAEGDPSAFDLLARGPGIPVDVIVELTEFDRLRLAPYPEGREPYSLIARPVDEPVTDCDLAADPEP